MEANTKKHPVLNTILSVLNVSLEVVLALIALGFIIGLYGVLS
jgi:ABC-type dipeptide/oligopeptide/nickel transport system permease component